MANVIINDSNLTNIAAAIREKNGTTTTYKPSEMASAIAAIETGGGGIGIPEEAYTITGNCQYKFAYGGWDWFVKGYGDKITTSKIDNANYMFYQSEIEEIPFDINFDGTSYRIPSYMFSTCEKLKSITGKIVDLYPTALNYMFNKCCMLTELPEFVNLNLNRLYTQTNVSLGGIFTDCYSLRSIPEDFLKQLYNPKVTSYVNKIFSGITGLYSIDEIRGVNPQQDTSVTITSNMFSSAFKNCCRVKNIIFATQDDGTPYEVRWKAQTIDLSGYYTGYARYESYILNYNSGIASDKLVSNDAQYAALKNDPDWYTMSTDYCRYNHDSAVNTINSLPDTSAYLASAGGTNTIKFKGVAGAKTDGGAINTLTEEEIAVATAKGWTVTLV